MIKLIFGNVGSGKTASVVRSMKYNNHKTIITNIDVKGKDFKHVKKLTSDMIVKKELIRTKRTGEPIYELSLNVEFWKNLISKEKQVDIIIDEAHNLFNPRRSMSKVNQITTDFVALLRRVLGSVDESDGELVLITQLDRRLDVITKEMATNIQYHIHHYTNNCKCGFRWYENNETADKMKECPICGNWKIKKQNHLLEVFYFKDLSLFENWKNIGDKTYYKRIYIKDIEKIFGNYDTLQWDDLVSDIY